jgi:arsenate reductase-like glutaredoxin family protein
LNDDSDQLFSSSSFSSQTSKKKFHKRSVSLQSISLSYRKKESKHKKISRIIQTSKRTTTTSLNDSSTTQEKLFKAKKKFRKTREKTTDEKILKMNRIIKQDLQKMLNVAIAANIATATAIISSQVSTSSETVLEQFTSADRSLER